MKELSKRWNASTPVFFKRIIHIGIVIGLIGGGLVSIPATALVGGVMISVGATASAIAKLTKI